MQAPTALPIAKSPSFCYPANASLTGGGEILSKPGEQPVKFRAPDGTLAEIVKPGRYESMKRRVA